MSVYKFFLLLTAYYSLNCIFSVEFGETETLWADVYSLLQP